jgi:flagellar hook-length control protein FliK
VQQVENQIAAAVQQGRRSLRMQLNPRELGAIEVHLVTTGQNLSVTLTADKAATGSLLEKQLEDLRANLANAGVHQVTVNVGHQAGSGQQGSSNLNSGSNPQHYSGGGKDKDTSQNEPMPDSQLPQSGQDVRVDYRI